MATLTFISDGYEIPSSSGLGFYGGSFGSSVPVGSHASSVFVCSSDGTTQGPQGNSNKWVATTGVIPNGAGAIHLTSLPNADATLQVRFTHTSAVQVPTATMYCYDRVSTSAPASGISFKLCELVHPSPAQGPGGSGTSTWETPAGSSVMPLSKSPGCSGLYAGNRLNSTRSDSCHDWYLAISASPDSIGSKLGALLLAIEYI